ncbi:MAG TPA: hypothetical protein VLL05_04130 [Terriglobales bacterium]|nr:hypothetical protein [Terriglobales bacterium]
MTKKAAVLSLTAVLAILGCVVGLSRQSAWAEGELPTGAASINLTSDQLFPNNPALVRAFIPTGSRSVKCLATLNESTFAEMGTVFFCGQRNSPIYGNGVMITILYPSAAPSDYGTSLTVWQAGARYYGAPVVCTVAQIADCL